ncbi:hypothetical protein PENTCL1PPCAC_1574, partial [Pristionchus entomophagus]
AKAQNLSIGGFVTSPGWNGCRNPNSGGIQTFRSPFDKLTDYYLLTDDDGIDVKVTVIPNLDSTHTLTLLINAIIGDVEIAEDFGTEEEE